MLQYLIKSGFSQDASKQALEISNFWRQNGVPLWPQTSKKEEKRMLLVLANAIQNQLPICFFNPVCPDYPQNFSTGKLGTGISQTAAKFISFIESLTRPLTKIPFSYNMLLADTETDLPKIVSVLADSRTDFLHRCQQTVLAIQREVPEKINVALFSEFFNGKWHQQQYKTEAEVRLEMKNNSKFQQWLETTAWKRTDKYKAQYFAGNLQSCIKLAVRHFAQYLTLRKYMQANTGSVLLNTDSPNLLAFRKPFGKEESGPGIPLIIVS